LISGAILRIYTWRSFPKNGTAYQRPWLTSWVDAQGNSLRFEYGEDALALDYGKIRRISSTSGSAVVLRYNEQGVISELVSKDGQRVGYSYNRWGDLIEVARPDNSTVTYTYLFEPSQGSGSVITNFVEAWVPFTNGQGIVDYQRGIVGSTVWTNLISTHRILRQETDGRILENEYDSKGRVLKQFANVGFDQRPVLNATFDYQNNDIGTNVGPTALLTGMTAVVDGLGNTNRYFYSNSKVTQIVDAEGNQDLTGWHLGWVYHDPMAAWNPNWMDAWYANQPPGSYPRSQSSITDHRGLVTSFKYNSSGDATNITIRGDLLGDGNTNTAAVTVIAHNADHMPMSMVLPSGTTNLFFYTNQWLLSRQESWPSGASAADVVTNLFFYTSVSNASNGLTSHGLRSIEVRAAGTTKMAISLA